jgi:hypothetical protein
MARGGESALADFRRRELSVAHGPRLTEADADTFYAPYYTLVSDYARAGRVLLWNPWSNAGSPDFAEPQVGAFSPIMVGFGALTGGHSAGGAVWSTAR